MTLFETFDVTSVLCTFALAFVVASYLYNWLLTRNYPPGPTGLPFLGYWPFLKKETHLHMTELSKEYGDVYSFFLGPQLNIIVNGYESIKEILNHPFVLARPPHMFDYMVGKAGFGGKSGIEWEDERRFTVQTMKNLGHGRGLWEKMIQNDALDLVDDLKRFDGQLVEFEEDLFANEANTLMSLLFGRSLDLKSDSDRMELIVLFGKEAAKNFSSFSLLFNLPWIIKTAEILNLSIYKKFIGKLRKFESIFEEEVNQRVKSEKEHVKEDFIGCYLQEMRKREGSGHKPNPFTLASLQGNLFILLLGGTETTLCSVSWLIVLMAEHQDVQEKVCKEIDTVLGRNGLVFYESRTQLPYTMATIKEMMRWVTINPLYPPRYVTEKFTFKNYTIPKGAHIVSNSWGMMHDPRYFDNPMEFRPERFLTNDENKILKFYGPFSFGKRSCPGESVAIMSMYIYFVTIMQAFKVRASDGAPPDLTYEYMAGVHPRPQKICFVER